MIILLTCPPMIGQLKKLESDIKKHNINISVPNFTGLMSEEELCKIKEIMMDGIGGMLKML